MKGQYVKIRHTKKEGWFMTIGGREIPQVRAVAVKFAVGNVDTVVVEFMPSGVSIDTDSADVVLVPVEPPMVGRQPVRVRARQWAGYRWRCGW
jgi:hypothetical protein